MLIVLEGCDGVGKTTIAKSLALLLDAEIVHCSSKTKNDFRFFFGLIEASKNRNIIADRFCYGQFVYQKSEDRPLRDYHTLNTLETELLKNGAKVVYVQAPPEEIKGRLSSRGEVLINGLTVEAVCDRFETLFKEHSILGDSVIVWNTGGEWK